MRAGRNQTTESRQARKGLREELGIADVLEHHVHALPVGEALHLALEILLAVIDAVIRTERDGGLDTLIGAGRRDHLGAEIFRNLDAGAAETAGRAHDENPFAALQLRRVAEQAERRRRVARHDRRHREIDAIGNGPRQRRRHLHVFGVAAPAVHADDGRRRGRRRRLQVLHGDDAIARLALAHPRADGLDDARRVDAEHVRQLDGHGVLAGAHDEIERAIDRDRLDADQHFAGAGHRRRHFLQAQHLGRAELPEDDRLHGTACVMNDCGGGLPHCDCRPSSAESRLGGVRAFSTSVSVQCSCTRAHGSFQ